MNNYIVSKEYSEAVTEVLYLLQFLPLNEVKKVPKKLLNFFEEVSSKNTILKLDPSKEISQMNLSDKTKDILAMLYINYWCTEEEKREYEIILAKNEDQYQKELHERYNIENLFNRNPKTEISDEYLPVVIEKEKWYSKVLNFIKRFFK